MGLAAAATPPTLVEAVGEDEAAEAVVGLAMLVGSEAEIVISIFVNGGILRTGTNEAASEIGRGTARGTESGTEIAIERGTETGSETATVTGIGVTATRIGLAGHPLVGGGPHHSVTFAIETNRPSMLTQRGRGTPRVMEVLYPLDLPLRIRLLVRPLLTEEEDSGVVGVADAVIGILEGVGAVFTMTVTDLRAVGRKKAVGGGRGMTATGQTDMATLNRAEIAMTVMPAIVTPDPRLIAVPYLTSSRRRLRMYPHPLLRPPRLHLAPSQLVARLHQRLSRQPLVPESRHRLGQERYLSVRYRQVAVNPKAPRRQPRNRCSKLN